MPELQLLHKHFQSAGGVKVLDVDQGVIEAIVSVFGVIDYADEMVMPGAFANSLKAKLPKGVWAHDWTMPVAKTLDAKELLPGDPLLPDEIKQNGGLYIKGQFNLETQRGRDAFSDIKAGIIDEFSFGYLVLKDEYDQKEAIRRLLEVDIYEWSPVLVGCNPATAILSAKGKRQMQTETKGQFLGDFVPNAMTIAALSRLNDALFYGVIYDAIYGSFEYDDEDETYTRTTEPLADIIAKIKGACDEFTDYAVRTVEALMDGAPSEAVAAAKSLREIYFADPGKSLSESEQARAGLTLAKQSEQALAACKDISHRLVQLKSLRLKDGRTLSAATRERLQANTDAVKAVYDDMNDLLGDSTSTSNSPNVTDDAEEKSAAAHVSQDEANQAHARFMELSFGITSAVTG